MSIVTDNLSNVLAGVLRNKTQMETAQKQTEVVGATISIEAQAAIDVLLEAFKENPQSIGHIISSQIQLKQIKKTMVEVDVLAAALQTAIANDLFLSQVEKQQEVNAQPQAPLSDATGSGALSASGGTSGEVSAAGAALSASEGNQGPSDNEGDGSAAA